MRAMGCLSVVIFYNKNTDALSSVCLNSFVVQGAGFEPAKPKVADLQSAVFDRSTTPASIELLIWSRLTDSNRGPTVYKTAALTN